jgi:hypothetical protein
VQISPIEIASALDTLPKFTRRSNMKGDSFVKSNYGEFFESNYACRTRLNKNTFILAPLDVSIEEEEEEEEAIEVQKKALEVLDTVDPDIETGKILENKEIPKNAR